MPPHSLPLTLSTTLTLLSRFQTTLSSPPPLTTPPTSTSESQSSPLPLLRASALTAKSHITKLSLLTITPPFTPSALTKVLHDLNTSALPSLVTAALLCVPDKSTRSFHDECIALSTRVLKTLADLVRSVEKVGNAGGVDKKGDGNGDLKEEVTGLTGRAWEACDAVISLADGGIIGFVTRKADEYHALVKDAISELEDWDPEDDDGEEKDVFGDAASSSWTRGDDDEDDDDAVDEATKHPEINIPHTWTAIVKLLRTTHLIYPATKKRRLKTFPSSATAYPTAQQSAILGALMSSLKSLPDTIDELVESLYERNAPGITACVCKIRDLAEEFRQHGTPWSGEAEGSGIGKEDEFTAWVGKWNALVGKAADDVTGTGDEVDLEKSNGNRN